VAEQHQESIRSQPGLTNDASHTVRRAVEVGICGLKSDVSSELLTAVEVVRSTKSSSVQTSRFGHTTQYPRPESNLRALQLNMLMKSHLDLFQQCLDSLQADLLDFLSLGQQNTEFDARSAQEVSRTLGTWVE
jgi:hypothetical protein